MAQRVDEYRGWHVAVGTCSDHVEQASPALQPRVAHVACLAGHAPAAASPAAVSGHPASPPARWGNTCTRRTHARGEQVAGHRCSRTTRLPAARPPAATRAVIHAASSTQITRSSLKSLSSLSALGRRPPGPAGLKWATAAACRGAGRAGWVGAGGACCSSTNLVQGGNTGNTARTCNHNRTDRAAAPTSPAAPTKPSFQTNARAGSPCTRQHPAPQASTTMQHTQELACSTSLTLCSTTPRLEASFSTSCMVTQVRRHVTLEAPRCHTALQRHRAPSSLLAFLPPHLELENLLRLVKYA